MIDKKAQVMINNVRSKTGQFWEKKRKTQALKMFFEAAKNVPAYQTFLKNNGCDPKKIKTWNDFITKVPFTSKPGYLRQFPLKKLTHNNLDSSIVFSSTSGSTGEPFYFPRSSELDWQYSLILEEYLNNISKDKNKRTLVVVAFGMGVWIGGVITYQGFKLASDRGKNISIITPGVNKQEIHKTLKKLSPQFDQTVLVGYPPFIKDIIDEAETDGINLKKLSIKLLFAAESFNESFRDYLAQKLGIKNVCTETLNIYGTADVGAMAFETPIAILIRRLLQKNKKAAKSILGGAERTPTLAQYNPEFITFEEIDGEVVLTGDNSVPLVRYKVGDVGGIGSFSKLEKDLKKEGIDLRKEAKKANVPIYELPFVWVYERKDLSVSLYGLQVYPEHIRETLFKKKFQDYLTGRFTLIAQYDANSNQYLEVNLELKKGKKMPVGPRRVCRDALIQVLREKNSEYRELSNFLGDKAYPRLVLWEHNDPTHFKSEIKQKWVKTAA